MVLNLIYSLFVSASIQFGGFYSFINLKKNFAILKKTFMWSKSQNQIKKLLAEKPYSYLSPTYTLHLTIFIGL